MRIVSLTGLVLLLGACGSIHHGRPDQAAPPPVVSGYQLTRDVIYTPPGWPKALTANIYRPEGAGPFPAVLVIHGGAWKRGDYGYSEGIAEELAERGYLAVSIKYRLVPDHVWPTQLQDVQQALRWMRAAEGGGKFGVDPARIASFGYSAGGHLAALAAGVADDPKWGAAGTQVKAVVSGGSPSDLPRFKHGKLVPAFIGAPWEQKPDDYVAASPLTHVRAGHPPVFVFHAGLDGLVPIEQAELYRDALARAGVTHEYFVIRGHGHISATLADDDMMAAALEFLDRYLR